MARLIRVKNNKGAADTWVGQTILPSEYFTLEESQYERWGQDDKVFADIAVNSLLVNNGADNIDDILNPLEGWKWLKGDNAPPQSVDGDWSILAKDHSEVTGNMGINWSIERELEAGEGYCEKLIVPDGCKATLNSLAGGSDGGAFTAHVCWMVEIAPDEYMRYNPWIRPAEIVNAHVDGAHSAGATVLSIKDITQLNTTKEIENLVVDYYYQFYDGSSNFFGKIASVDTASNQITLMEAIPEDLADNATLTLTDRSVGRIESDHGGLMMTWGSSPSAFEGNGKNFFMLRMVNEDPSNVAVITATINGWHGPA